MFEFLLPAPNFLRTLNILANPSGSASLSKLLISTTTFSIGRPAFVELVYWEGDDTSLDET